ncbi:AbrB/MazE/SpoVT family DNA-binding domain-containing protein (plasmid) [Oscillospiraceae bacterium MB08-C2-2]|nr:AbrB/MazE/SpoVT family DNA-binding domain-containing protein [Oscillospiraceae bacterium MB08-C2-2]
MNIVKIGTLGRMSIPASIRSSLNWQIGDTLEILAAGETVTIRKTEPGAAYEKRLLDINGRLHLPVVIRKAVDLHINDTVELLVAGDTVIVVKRESAEEENN